MSKLDPQILSDAFDKAVALENSEQSEFLIDFEHEHPALAPQLRRLIDADARRRDVLRSWIETESQSLTQSGEDPWIGRELGAWKITRRLGAGGMGAVFLASRIDEQFDQTAAVKVMGSQLLSDRAAERFRQERQILASLSHPNIAGLIDGGATELKLPYLVMEYVDGVSIDQYCRANELDLSSILTLFQKVCAAIDYAHRNLVVHRDLKPDNILVRSDGEPQLLDFGIAKLIEPLGVETDTSPGSDPITQIGARAITLAYASPEQVRGEPVSTATDIYALGVLLYQLLTGAFPYGEESDTAYRLQNAILNVEPPPPSSVLRSGSQTMADSIGPSPANYHVRLQRRRAFGDLNNIVLKCLRKQPEQRYASVKDLSDDIGRFLRMEPVEARPNNWRYVFSKFARRNRSSVIAATAALIALVGLTGYYTVQLSDERNAARVAAHEAQVSAAEAEEISAFVISLLNGASPEIGQGDEITARQLLEQGVERIDAIEDQPEVKARLLNVMSGIYVFLGDEETALNLAQKARILFETGEADDVKTESDTYNRLGEALMFLGRAQEGVPHLRTSHALAVEAFGETSERTMFLLARLGLGLYEDGAYDLAIETLREAREGYLKAAGDSTEQYVDILGNLALSLDAVGRFRESREIYAELIQQSVEVSGKLHPNTIIRLSNRGKMYSHIGDYKNAQRDLSDALMQARQVFDEMHYSQALYSAWLAEAHAGLGDFENANRLAEEGLQHAATHLGPEAGIYFYTVHTAELIKLIEDPDYDVTPSLALPKQNALATFGAFSARRGRFLYLEALSAYGRGELETALTNIDEVVDQQATVRFSLGRNAWLLKARILDDLERYDTAAEIYLKERELIEANLLSNEASSVPLLTQHARHLRLTGELERSMQTAREAIAIGQATLPPGNWISANAHLEYATTAIAMDAPNDVRNHAEIAWNSFNEVFDADHPLVIQALELLE